MSSHGYINVVSVCGNTMCLSQLLLSEVQHSEKNPFQTILGKKKVYKKEKKRKKEKKVRHHTDF